MITTTYNYYLLASSVIPRGFGGGAFGTGNPSVIALDGGRSVVLSDYTVDEPTGVRTYAASTVYDAAGQIVPGGRVLFGSVNDASAFNPTMGLGLSGGDAVLFDVTTSGITNSLLYQMISPTSLSHPLTVITSVANSSIIDVSFATNDVGFVIAWATSADPTNWFAAIYNGDGTPRRSPYDIAGSGKLAPLVSGSGFLMYSTSTGVIDRFDSFGNLVGSQISIGSAITEVLELNDGGLVVQLSPATFRIYNADGSPRSGVITLPDVGSGTEQIVDLIATQDGGFTAHIFIDRVGSANEPNYFAWFNADGSIATLGPFQNNDGGQGSINWEHAPGQSVFVQVNEIATSDARFEAYLSYRTISSDGAGDTVNGSSGAEVMEGNGGDDILNGLGGDDTLRGGSDADALSGGEGADSLDGGTGNDAMDGGGGDDTIVYDAADTFSNVEGGGGYDILIVNDASVLPTSLDLASASLEQANVIFLDHASEAWSAITVYANGAWQTLSRDVLYDDGTRLKTYYDWGSNQTWSSYDESYDSAARLLWTRTFHDAGGYETRYWDALSNQSWSSYIDYANAAEQTLARRIFLDNGRSETITYDSAGNQAWSQYIEYANASGQRDTLRVFLYSGRTETTYYDVAGSQGWSSYVDYGTSTGVVDARRVFLDDGRSESTWFDILGTQSWSHYTDYLNSSGQRTAQRTHLDSGRIETTFYDVGNAEAWSNNIEYARGNGVVDTRRFNYDDGHSTVTYFDVDNQNSWAQYTDTYDASGNFTGRTGVYDDGSLF
jgi:hypothetical protein